MTTNLLSDEIILCEKYKIQYKDVPLEYIHRELVNKVDWYRISGNQTLSESFIEKYADKVNWGWISEKQHLSEQFISRYEDKVDWDALFLNKHIKLTKMFKTKYKNNITSKWRDL